MQVEAKVDVWYATAFPRVTSDSLELGCFLFYFYLDLLKLCVFLFLWFVFLFAAKNTHEKSFAFFLFFHFELYFGLLGLLCDYFFGPNDQIFRVHSQGYGMVFLRIIVGLKVSFEIIYQLLRLFRILSYNQAEATLEYILI